MCIYVMCVMLQTVLILSMYVLRVTCVSVCGACGVCVCGGGGGEGVGWRGDRFHASTNTVLFDISNV